MEEIDSSAQRRIKTFSENIPSYIFSPMKNNLSIVKIAHISYFSGLSPLCTVLSGALNFVSLIWSNLPILILYRHLLAGSYFVPAVFGRFLFCTSRLSFCYEKQVFQPELYKGLPSRKKCLLVIHTSPISLSPPFFCRYNVFKLLSQVRFKWDSLNTLHRQKNGGLSDMGNV